MPEIVELKIFAQSLKDRFLHKAVFVAKNKRSDFDVAAVCEGKYLTDVRAHGKEMFFWFDGLPAFSAHLMLNGGFAVLNENTRPAAVDIVAEWQFENKQYLTLFDPDGYAKVAPFDALPTVPEATAIDEDVFLRLMQQKKNAAVKSVLCDQKCIRGIGNAYADEILYAARIHPAVKCGKIPFDAQHELYIALRAVLAYSIEQYGKMYRGVTCGEMRDLVRVHTRARITHDGEIIKTAEVGGKKTYYTLSQRKFE